jgi:hypothetical protein
MGSDLNEDDLSDRVKACLKPLGWTGDVDNFDPPKDSNIKVQIGTGQTHGHVFLTVHNN